MNINGTTLFCETIGHGPSMLLTHGMGFDHTLFRPWFDPLADQLQLVYYDSRGNGRSTRPATFDELTFETLADDTEALRKHLGLDQIILYGHSFGGPVALEYALKYGSCLNGLILDATAPAFDYQPVVVANAQARANSEQMEHIVNGFSGLIRDDSEFRRRWQAILPLYFNHYDQDVGGAVVDGITFSIAAFNHFNALIWSVNLIDRLAEIQTPTLVLVGKHDWVTPPAQGAERLHAGLPNSKLVVFDDSGHFAFIEQQAEYLETVREWVDEFGFH